MSLPKRFPVMLPVLYFMRLMGSVSFNINSGSLLNVFISARLAIFWFLEFLVAGMKGASAEASFRSNRKVGSGMEEGKSIDLKITSNYRGLVRMSEPLSRLHPFFKQRKMPNISENEGAKRGDIF